MCRRPHTFQHDEIEKRDVISLLMDCCWPSSEREIGSSFLRSAYGCARAYAYQVDGGSSIRVRREVCGSRREVYITFLDLRLIKHLVVFCLGFLYIAGDDVIIYIYCIPFLRQEEEKGDVPLDMQTNVFIVSLHHLLIRATFFEYLHRKKTIRSSYLYTNAYTI